MHTRTEIFEILTRCLENTSRTKDSHMQNFSQTLISEEKNINLPDEYDYFGGLIGSWNFDYVDHNTLRTTKGEWHFVRVLEGMAIQDVIILPARDSRTATPHPDEEYGTTLRIYNPATYAWDIAYCYTGRIMRLEARKHDGKIVLTNIADERQKWVFACIEENTFHWQNITVVDDGTWHINVDLYASRI